MAIGPKIVYGGGPTTLQLDIQGHGLIDFTARYASRVHDNVAISGKKERVFEHSDVFVSFTTPALRIGTDITKWQDFSDFALPGGVFKFYAGPVNYPTTYFNCVSDDTAFDPKRVAPGRYSASFLFRVVPDSFLPTPFNILGWFNQG